MNKSVVWTAQEFLNKECSSADVGKPKTVLPQQESPFIEATIATLREMPEPNMAELRQAALRVVRGTMGYEEFLIKNPEFTKKFLLATARESVKPAQQPTTVQVNLNWVQPGRLSYRETLNVEAEASDLGHPSVGYRPKD